MPPLTAKLHAKDDASTRTARAVFSLKVNAAIGRTPIEATMKSGSLMLGALLATAALLAACSTGTGPLGPDSAWGSVCVPGALGQPMADGMSVLYNHGTSPVTVTGVKLLAPHGLAMTKAWLVPGYKPPHGAWSYVGTQLYPPIHWHTWPKRQAIPGAVIKPGQPLNLVFGLTRRGSKDGSTSGTLITYTADRTSYTLQETFGYAIIGKTSCPAGF